MHQGTASQNKQCPDCGKEEKHPPSPASSVASSIPAHRSTLARASLQVRVKNKVIFFYLTIVYSPFQTLRQNLTCAVLHASQMHYAVKCLTSDASLSHHSRSNLETLIGHILRQQLHSHQQKHINNQSRVHLIHALSRKPC